MTRTDYYGDPEAPRANSLVPSVTAAVQDARGWLLLVHKIDNNLWALPGGAMEIGESISEAVVREVQEETGVQVEVEGLVGVYSDPNHVMAYADGEVRQEFSICFRARVLGGHPRQDGTETKAAQWVDPTELPSLPIHPSMRRRIDAALVENVTPEIA